MVNFSLYVFINVAMVMGLIPVVGAPLPGPLTWLLEAVGLAATPRLLVVLAALASQKIMTPAPATSPSQLLDMIWMLNLSA